MRGFACTTNGDVSHAYNGVPERATPEHTCVKCSVSYPRYPMIGVNSIKQTIFYCTVHYPKLTILLRK